MIFRALFPVAVSLVTSICFMGGRWVLAHWRGEGVIAPVDGTANVSRLSTWWCTIFVLIAILATTAVIEFAMGRTPLCTCGVVRLWSSDIFSSENSQQLTDAYTFTHIIHGIIFYGILRIVAKRVSVGVRALMAVSLESAWEVLENTDLIIERYRAATLSLNYFGDSIFNSVGDILA